MIRKDSWRTDNRLIGGLKSTSEQTSQKIFWEQNLRFVQAKSRFTDNPFPYEAFKRRLLTKKIVRSARHMADDREQGPETLQQIL